MKQKIFSLFFLMFSFSAYTQVRVESRFLDITQAHKKAAEEGKYLFAMVSTSWCGYCKQFKQTKIPTAEFQQMLSKRDIYFTIIDVTKSYNYVNKILGFVKDENMSLELPGATIKDFVQNAYYNTKVLKESYPKFILLKPSTVQKVYSQALELGEENMRLFDNNLKASITKPSSLLAQENIILESEKDFDFIKYIRIFGIEDAGYEIQDIKDLDAKN